MRRTNKFFSQFLRLNSAFWQGAERSDIQRSVLILIALTICQVAIAVVITEWSAGLFNALDRHSMPALFKYVALIVVIFFANMVITAWHLNVKRGVQLRWRKWLTKRLLEQWMSDGRHYLVTHIQGEDQPSHDNPDGRIAEDARIATEYAVDLLHSLFYCLLLLISFSKILWTLSGVVLLDLYFFQIPIYGHLVWLAIAYAASASMVGWLFGQPLTKATDSRQTVEANFRFDLVNARENSLAIALIHGEDSEKQHFRERFRGIVNAWDQQTKAWTHIQLFTSGYSILSMAFPILVSSPRYILGSISLGGLMQSAQAFQQMAAALSWPVDNMAKVAEWRASVERVLSLAQALEQLESHIDSTDRSRISFTKTDKACLRLTDLTLERLDKIKCLDSLNIEIKPGERVLFAGNMFTGSKLVKAIAGLWPWGEGKIELPADVETKMFFMPPRPYLPYGSLREAVCYPYAPAEFSENTLERAFTLAGVESLWPELDRVECWAKSLSREQQQRLGMVRLLLQEPNWILIQEAFDSLPPEGELAMLQLIRKQLPNAALLTMTNQPTAEKFHQRTIKLC